MAAFRRNSETDEFVSDVYGAPAMKAYFVFLKRINRLLKILFISLDACQALEIKKEKAPGWWTAGLNNSRPDGFQLSVDRVGKVLEIWSCQVSESSSTRAQISPVPAASKLRKLPNIRK